jgi:16S rRNA (cytidine1402-2'-O)-methyltransferase
LPDAADNKKGPVCAATSEQHTPGKLFVVSMPIGNPEDITLRALRVLKSVAAICCEDLRVSRPQLAGYGIETDLLSLQMRAEAGTLLRVQALIMQGQSAAVISDCGTPLIADPGIKVIQTVLDAGGTITAVPGASAVLTAIAASGFKSAPFYFAGFPPRSSADRAEYFHYLRQQSGHIVLFEACPYLRDTMRCLVKELGPNRRASFATHLTTTREEWNRGTLSSLAAITDKKPGNTGPCTIVISASI